MENLFKVRQGKTFVYPEGVQHRDAPNDMEKALIDPEGVQVTKEIMDIMREEIDRAAGLPQHNGNNHSALDELDCDDTDLLPDFYPRETDLDRLTMVDEDHLLFLPANLQIGIEVDEFLDG